MRVILLVEFVDVDRVGEIAQLCERLVQSQGVVGVVREGLDDAVLLHD